MDAVGRSAESIRRSLTRHLSVRSSYSPAFSSDDRTLVYISDTTGVPQVWSLGLPDGAPQQLTYYEDRIGFVSTAKKSDSFVFGKDRGGNERFQLYHVQGGDRLRQLTDEADVIHSFGGWSPEEDSILYSSNSRNRAFFDVYAMDLTSAESRAVHKSDHTNYGMDWSPDGGSLLMERVHAPFNQDLFLIRTEDPDPVCLTDHEGDAAFGQPQFAPDGKKVYALTDLGREFTAPAVIGLEGGKPDFMFDAKWDVEELALSDDGKRIAFTTNIDGVSGLTVWEPPGPQDTVKTPAGAIAGLKWSHDGGSLAFSFSGANHNQDIWLHDLRDGSTRRVTRSSAAGLDLGRSPPPGLFRYPSFDGLSVPCFLYAPDQSGSAPPAVVYIHGGPESQFRPGFNPIVRFFTSMGLSVVAPNVRGSSGYGRTYTHLDDVRLRMDSVADIESLVIHLEKEGKIDPKKVGVMGGSYGGFMVLACMYRYPKLWAVGVDIVGISNFVTFLKHTGPWRRKLRAVEYGDPVKDGKFLERISPLNNASKIRAPLFMIHGTNDPRVPFKETRQIEKELKKLKRTVKVMVFDDEGHGLVKLANRIRGYTAAAEFLLQHLVQD